MIFNRTEKEEKAYLMDIIALLAANIEQSNPNNRTKNKFTSTFLHTKGITLNIFV